MNPHIRSRPSALAPRSLAVAGWLPSLVARVREPEIAWVVERDGLDPADAEGCAARVVEAAREALQDRRRIHGRADLLREATSGVEGDDLRAVLVHHLRQTVPDARRLRGDLKALDRHLDLDALLEREAERAEQAGVRLEVAIEVLRALFGREVELGSTTDAQRLLEHSGMHALLDEVARAEPRAPTRRAAVLALAEALSTLVAARVEVSSGGIRTLQSLVRDPAESPWIRRRALSFVRGLDEHFAVQWLREFVAVDQGADDFLVRAAAVELLLEHDGRWVYALLRERLDDPSELVRFTVVDGLARRAAGGEASAVELLARVRVREAERRVRARAAAALGHPATLDLLAEFVGDEPMVAGFAVERATEAIRAGHPAPPALLSALHAARDGDDAAVARRAGFALHCARLADDPARRLVDGLADMAPGTARTLQLPSDQTPLDLARALVVLAEDGFGFQLDPGPDPEAPGVRVRVTRGDAEEAALWRTLHELRHPAPVKRQGHSHAVARGDAGMVRVPPRWNAEQAVTDVPGQRVHDEAEDGWAPEIPMVDDFLHAAARGRTVIVTSEGVTTIEAPRTRLGRWRARARIVWRYARLDARRLTALRSRETSRWDTYLLPFREMGFTTRGPRAMTGPAAPLAYLLDLGGNTLLHLIVAVILLMAVAFGRTTLAVRAIRRDRAAIPLSIGGWGTRGKSGTERLKAGLFEGLGISVLCKSTGCEAMVLHGPPGGQAMELFLYRPYDKATIWEQAGVVRLAPGLDARVMLWECMALNPVYVDILQSGWMRDDLATLTNAYPDHEDIQGPSGVDVATVIGGFAPPNAYVITTEQAMLPILREQSRLRSTVLVDVPRAARDLVPIDLMARMPHAEHPSNVSLVAAMAEALGLEPVEAIGLLAERVLPDLGALVVQPEARHLGRRVEFAMGMSANDRLSFRHNWRRTGFAAHDVAADPDVWLVTVINNRADRVPRSRVFASIAATDAPAHRHVLIGTNLNGFKGYLLEATTEKLSELDLSTPARVDALFSHLKLVEAGALGARCGANLGASEALVEGWRRAASAVVASAPTLDAGRAAAVASRQAASALEAGCEEGEGLADALVEASARHAAWQAARAAPVDAVKRLYLELVEASVIIVESAHASGDQIIDVAVGCGPPGAHVRILGAQNIKGTGLDFAYQWVFWGGLHRSLQELDAPDPGRRKAALGQIEANPLGSMLACAQALRALRRHEADPALGGRPRALIQRIEKRQSELLAKRRAAASAGRKSLWRTALERLLDPFDAVVRRSRSDQVFQDLADRRISHARAQGLLKALTLRQKGGWLGG